jgi:pimeloyl-ACP methyl ester carboxylesterase
MNRMKGYLAIIILFIVSSCTAPAALADLFNGLTNQESKTVENPLLLAVETSTPGKVTNSVPSTLTMTIYPTQKPPPLLFEEADRPGTYWVTNPASQARLFVQVVHAPEWDGNALPALVLVPGGMATGINLLPEAKILASRGFTVILFDPDGRGRSEGVEDYGGFVHQDGLAAVVRFASEHEDVLPAKIGLVSFSYGITMATGVLARYPLSGVLFLIDWEGPVDRADTTTSPSGECVVESTRQMWKPCDDQKFWSEREAIHFIKQVKVPAYQRLQSEKDHVQPDVSHSIRIINEAINAGIGWVRLNKLPANQIYDENNPPKMTPEQMDKTRDNRIAEIAHELFQEFSR